MSSDSKTISNFRFYGLLILFVLVVVAVLLLRVHAAHPVVDRPSPTPLATPMATSMEDARFAHPDKTFAITVKDEKLVNGPSAMTVSQGDSVRVNLTAEGDEAKVQLDGYDIITEADPTDDTPGGFSFIADKAGVFSFYAINESTSKGAATPTRTKLGTITVK